MTNKEYMDKIDFFKARLALRMSKMATNGSFRQALKQLDKWNQEVKKLKKAE